MYSVDYSRLQILQPFQNTRGSNNTVAAQFYLLVEALLRHKMFSVLYRNASLSDGDTP